MLISDIRSAAINFFVSKGHLEVPSASLISKDPSVMFTIAGMLPFVPYFLGEQTPPSNRVVSVQKCIRTSDIDEVGKTVRHGTFFQMMGNFSFGDYFKEQAVEYAWEFLTSQLQLSPDRLWATVYEDDTESERYWRQVGVPAERIQRLGKKTNFWSTGQAGPAGPCSEVFYDLGKGGPEGGPATDSDRYLEIWNLVFMQYLRSGEQDFKILGDLPRRNIDTGMGIERVAIVTQGVDNIYETDELRPVLDEAAALSGKRYGQDQRDDVNLRILADHIRSSLMLIGDGLSPSNEGRGYVLRRLLRRSVRAVRLLGVEQLCFEELFTAAAGAMKRSYPELAENFPRILQVALTEEQAFSRTLQSGSRILDQAIAKTGPEGAISGSDAFKLHDTHGFPIDLIVEIAGESGLSVDREAFDQLMQEQKDRAREALRDKNSLDVSAYRDKQSVFLGYTELAAQTVVTGIFADDLPVSSAAAGQQVNLVLAQTPFYAAAGGQEADRGTISSSNFLAKVLDVFSPLPGLTVHRCEILSGVVAEGEQAEAKVDERNRFFASQAHSATHIVHAVLRNMFGDEAHQMGSYNRAGYLRFDFRHAQPLSAEAKSELEALANDAVQQRLPITTQLTTLEQAQAAGAMALFSEKYADNVRMVEIGGAWSRELCGGTHVGNSSEVALINLVGENSVGAGVRRVECFTGLEAFSKFAQERALLDTVMRTLKTSRDGLESAVIELTENLKRAEKSVQKFREQLLRQKAQELAAAAKDKAGTAVVAATVNDLESAEELKTVLAKCRAVLPKMPQVLFLCAVIGDRVFAAAASADNALKANDLISAAAPKIDGKGGGQAAFAQGSGTNPAGAAAALSAVEQYIFNSL